MRNIVIKSLSILVFLLGFASISFSQKKSKPNVLLILIDDLKPTLGTYGDDVAVSPNIDKLASEGIQFNNAYCNQAVCVASRYNLMLGSRSTSTGIYNFGRNFRDVIPDAVTLPQVFMKNGYHAEAIGKVFHVGHGNVNDKASWSVPHWSDKLIEYLDPASTNRELTREEAFFENTPLYIPNTPPNHELPRGAAWEELDVTDEAYADGRVARRAIDRLREFSTSEEEPFFLAVGFVRPHLPFSVPKKYWDMYDPSELPLPKYQKPPKDAPSCSIKRRGEITQFFPLPNTDELFQDDLKRKLIHGYYAGVSYTDAQIGKVLSELERLNLDDNTIVVLWGDHGWHLGDHGVWTKHTNLEQATHIPLIIKEPGLSSNGSKTNQMAETVDIYPTLVDLAGIKQPKTPQPLDGIVLSPVLNKPELNIKDHAYHAYPMGGYLGEAIRTERYRMVRWTNMRNHDDIKYELYDFETDPLETKNIAKEKPEVVDDLVAKLNKYPKAVM